MDITDFQGKLTRFLKKYKYVVLVLVIGLVLMAIPEGDKEYESTEEQSQTITEIETTIDDQLATVLSKIDGAGKVEVMLTVGVGEETIYQTNEDISFTGDTNTSQTDTVTVTDAQRNQNGLIRQINPPTYLGAIIVCQGADDPTVRLAIVDAVSKITGLGTDRISVLKMK